MKQRVNAAGVIVLLHMIGLPLIPRLPKAGAVVP